MKTLEILIIVVVLFLLALAVGCKDEADAEDYFFTIDSNDPSAVIIEKSDLNDPNRIYFDE